LRKVHISRITAKSRQFGLALMRIPQLAQTLVARKI
jgi:hypothetical protein